MRKTASEIAEEMRAVAHDQVKSREMLTGLFAESVELQHVPRSSTDGPIAGRLLAEIARRESEAVVRALPDIIHDDPEITVEAGAIRVRRRTVGTLLDGTSVDVRTDTLFSITDGEIAALQSDMDASDRDTWQRVLAAGGFLPPGRMQPDRTRNG